MTLPSLSLGPLRLEHPVLAAPIAGFTDAVFRGIVRRFGGCGLIFTEMISAETWVRGAVEPERLDGVAEEERPLGVQLWAREADLIEEAARRLAALRVSLVDLNFGCPARRIMGKHGAGATLLRDPTTIGRMVAAAVRGAGGIPVTAKIRLGQSLQSRTAPEVARAAEANGAVAVTVHGRAADQNYGVPCLLEMIAEVVASVSIPVIANGDIRGPESAERAIAATGARGVMVAREALTRPWVFREIAAALRGEPIPEAPTLAEQKALLLAHHGAMAARQGDRHGTIVMRKFASRYLSGLPNGAAFRNAINKAECGAEFREIVERFLGGEVLDGPTADESPLPELQESACA